MRIRRKGLIEKCSGSFVNGLLLPDWASSIEEVLDRQRACAIMFDAARDGDVAQIKQESDYG